ncbi:voltage-gated chloride channel family protein [Acinetobacter ursingii]|uniref:voltage-gated chloride channel family protein n=1 Tax=Acinetobacter ursingii TaxID=108980 RepID=UPI0021CDDB60|nr:voltage-gated chloride channel family protein [Acinetobacter ursingii]MCU4482354.1 voltage-gated chloride channel family protein [Acinetobacter ursingii]MCU4506676.1 voltage-gated chloride channel family protein [Acinetobacter ursingii]
MKVFPSSEYTQIIRYTAYWVVASVMIGLISGLSSSLIFVCFDLANQTRISYPWLVYFLPFIGLLIGYLFYYYGTPIEKGTHLLIDEIHHPRAFIPKRMTPLVFFTAILTQIFGGSAGREAPAVQLSGALTDHITQAFRVPGDNRKIFLIASIGSGFAAIFGLPLAGAIYGLEITALGKLRYSAVFPCFVSALVASQIPELFHISHPHQYYVVSSFPDFNFTTISSLIVAGLLFGFVARIFIASILFVSKQLNHYVRFMPFRPMVGGILIMLMTIIVGHQKFNGLGVGSIISSFYIDLPVTDFLGKIIFTATTLGSGFKGGEITPLFFVGTTFGNALGQFLPLPISLLAGLGLVSLFAGASKAPLTSIVLAIELFGADIAQYTVITCLLAYLFSGNCGLYIQQNLKLRGEE